MKKNHVTILAFFLCQTDASVIATCVQMHWLRVYFLESFCIHHHLALPGSGQLVAGAAAAAGHRAVPSPGTPGEAELPPTLFPYLELAGTGML